MDRERIGAVRRRLGPVGMSLAAAALTAAAFAAISVADSDKSKDGAGAKDEQTMWSAGPPGGGVGVMGFRGRLSEEDQQKLEEFRQCMEDNGAPKPPDPGEIDPSQRPPDPPSEADREKIEAAYEACKDKLPEEFRNGHPPHLGGPGCAGPPGVPQEEGRNRQGSRSESGMQSSGAAA